MKRYATTLVLGVLAIGLGVFLWLDRGRVTEGERKLRASNVFVTWRRDELSRIEIAHQGETIVFARDAKADSAWRMLSPLESAVDQAAIERLITTLEFSTVLRNATDGPALGLQSPRATGSITMGAVRTSFALGEPSPRPERSSYFRVDGGEPIVVSPELTVALLASSDVYRDRSIIPYLSIELARLGLTHDGAGVSVERVDDEAFRVEGEGLLASRAALDKVWGALADLRADSFPSVAEAEKSVTTRSLTITMTPKDGDRPPAELVVGEPGLGCPSDPGDVLILRRRPNPLAACVTAASLEALHVSAEALVERHPFTVRADEVDEVRLEWLVPNEVRPIEFARKGSGFRERSPEEHDMTPDEADAAEALLARMVSAEAERATRPAGALADGGAFAPVARVRIHAGEREQVVEVGGEPSTGASSITLRRAKDDARLQVSKATISAFLPIKTSLRPRALLADARRVTRVTLDCGTHQDLVDEGSGFRYVAPHGYEADASLLDLVSALTRGKVDAWVADAPSPEFGLDPASASTRCTVSLGFEDGQRPREVTFGAEGEGGVYGKLGDEPAVFVAPRAFRDLAAKIYVSRAYLRAPAERIASVSATYDGKPVSEATGEVLREVVATLYADGVAAVSRPSMLGGLGPRLTLEVREGDEDAEAGATPRVHHIVCARAGAGAPEWLCELAGVRATFVVASNKLAPVLARPVAPTPYDGSVARDAGPK